MLGIGIGRGFEHRVENRSVAEKFFSKVLKISRIFRFGGHCILKNSALSTVNYRDMGHGMGQRISLKIRPNHFTRKIKEKFRNHGDFGTFLVAEAGLEPTTSGL